MPIVKPAEIRFLSYQEPAGFTSQIKLDFIGDEEQAPEAPPAEEAPAEAPAEEAPAGKLFCENWIFFSKIL